MPIYYIIDASYGPRVCQTGLRYGNVEAKTPTDAINRVINEADYFMHARIEVFDNEESYKLRKPPLANFEKTNLLKKIISNDYSKKRFEEFFVGPFNI